MSEEGGISEVQYCPFCGTDEIKYIGKTEIKNSLYFCENCKAYFVAYEMKPPIKVTIEE
jgi:transposase-like protein